MCNILLFGYGKIGQVKAKIYESLGCNICVVDPNKKWKQDIYPDISLVDADFDLYDISTPTDTHITILKKILQRQRDASVLIEKPLCNNLSDYEDYLLLHKEYPLAKIFLSENYFYSSVMSDLKALIKQQNWFIRSIQIEFSKDRSIDVSKGRFVDTMLGGIGIEVPHMLSLLYDLGIKKFSVNHIEHYLNGINWNGDDDFILEGLSSAGEQISLYQSLVGNYRLKDSNFNLPAEKSEISSYRVMKVVMTCGHEVWIQFEPIPGSARFFSTIFDSYRKQKKSLNDNTIKRLIKDLICTSQKVELISSKSDFITWQTKNLFKLKDLCQ